MLASAETAKAVISEQGVAIVPYVLNEDECKAMNIGMWDTLEHISKTWEVCTV